MTKKAVTKSEGKNNRIMYNKPRSGIILILVLSVFSAWQALWSQMRIETLPQNIQSVSIGGAPAPGRVLPRLTMRLTVIRQFLQYSQTHQVMFYPPGGENDYQILWESGWQDTNLPDMMNIVNHNFAGTFVPKPIPLSPGTPITTAQPYIFIKYGFFTNVPPGPNQSALRTLLEINQQKEPGGAVLIYVMTYDDEYFIYSIHGQHVTLMLR